MIELTSASATLASEFTAGRRDGLHSDDRGFYAIASGPGSGSQAPSAPEVFTQLALRQAPLLGRVTAALLSGQSNWSRVEATFQGVFGQASEIIASRLHGVSRPDTSATLLICREGMAVMAHVGTTRGYVIAGNRIVRVTHDHGQKQAFDPKAEQTLLAVSRDELFGTQALGTGRALKIDAVSFRLKPGTRLLLASEGVSNIVKGEELLEMSGRAANLQAFADKVCTTARMRSRVADASLIAIDVGGPGA